jgi:hypothetical protein
MLTVRTSERIYAGPVKNFASENVRKMLEGKNKSVQERKKEVDVKEPYSDSEELNNFETDDSKDDTGDEQADCLFFRAS